MLIHTGEKWSRLSEELPLHRVVDLVSLVASTLEQCTSARSDSIKFPANFFENQAEAFEVPVTTSTAPKRRNLQRLVGDELIRRRLGKLAGVLIRLRNAEKI